MTTVAQITKKSKAEVYRRVLIKRRLTGSAGGYESSWLDITEYVKSFGRINTSVELFKYNSFRLSGINLKVKNDDGAFNLSSSPQSLWNGYLTQYGTKVWVESGYVGDDGVEIPSTTAVNSGNFLGIVTDEIVLKSTNEVMLPVKPMYSILDDVPASKLTGLTGSQTASEIIGKIRDLTDTNSVSVFSDYISAGAWNIDSTSAIYPDINTGAVAGLSMWQVMTKLAETENKAIFFDPNGEFYFKSKVENQSTSVWEFTGISKNTNNQYGHTIKSIDSYKEATSKIFTRVRVKINETETSTSYRTQEAPWTIGDSSTSYVYGERTFAFENTWLNTTTADTLIAAIHSTTSLVRRELNIHTKYIPTLRIFDRVSVDFVSKDIDTGSSLWGSFLWGHGLWGGGNNNAFEITGNYRIIGLEQDIDNFQSSFHLREI